MSRLRLQIQYGKLLDWGEAAGIVESQDVFDKKMKVHGGTVMALLSEMRSLLKKMRTYSLRYDGIAGQLPEEEKAKTRYQPIDTVNMEEYRAIFESKDVPRDKRKYPKGLNRLVQLASGGKDIAKQPKRLRWAVIDEKNFKDDLDRMVSLTDFLHETLGDHQTKLLRETTQETYLAILQLTKDIHQIKLVAEVALEARVVDSEDDGISMISRAETLVERSFHSESGYSLGADFSTIRGMTVFEKLAHFRAVNASLYHPQPSTPLPMPEIDMDKELSNMHQLKGTQNMAAIYQGKNVWVEWKAYTRDDQIETATDIIYKLSEKVRRDAQRLVALLQAKEKPVEFCVPDCAGYCDDSANDRFGFVYEVRDTNLRSFRPISLLQLLEGDSVSLKAKVSLAQRLSTCLLYLHATNWLHKALRSASILFFSASVTPEIDNPYISSFEYSRPDKNDATFAGPPQNPDWAVYCHPDYLGRPGNFRKSYDIYSLGIILLEIAYWKPVTEIFGIDSLGSESIAQEEFSVGERSRRVADIRHSILTEPKYLENVRKTMGDKYQSAVRACIAGLDYFHLPKEVDQTDPVIATLLQQAYLRLVVDVLNAILV